VNDKPERTAARMFLRFEYAIHAVMTSAMGIMGYDQTAMTMVHACVLSPESNAMTESPATSSQMASDPRAKSWERIIQMRRPVRLGCDEGDAICESM